MRYNIRIYDLLGGSQSAVGTDTKDSLRDEINKLTKQIKSQYTSFEIQDVREDFVSLKISDNGKQYFEVAKGKFFLNDTLENILLKNPTFLYASLKKIIEYEKTKDSWRDRESVLNRALKYLKSQKEDSERSRDDFNQFLISKNNTNATSNRTEQQHILDFIVEKFDGNNVLLRKSSIGYYNRLGVFSSSPSTPTADWLIIQFLTILRDNLTKLLTDIDNNPISQNISQNIPNFYKKRIGKRNVVKLYPDEPTDQVTPKRSQRSKSSRKKKNHKNHKNKVHHQNKVHHKDRVGVL